MPKKIIEVGAKKTALKTSKKTSSVKIKVEKSKENFQSAKSICFYFQVHQPYRLNDYNYFKEDENFFEGPAKARNLAIFEKVADKCYLPANAVMLDLLHKFPEFKISFSLSGVFLEQCLEFGEKGKAVLESFQKLVKTGQVELLSETYYHSLTFLYSKADYAAQILKHRKLIKKLFGVETKVFRNTELIYNNEIANFIKELGFKGMLLEGWDPILSGKKQHDVLKPVESGLHPADLEIAKEQAIYAKDADFGLLLKDYKLSDDIAFRFSNKGWEEYPLTVDKYVDWLGKVYGDTINLFMDYETFGEHQWEDTGIFEFLKALPEQLLQAGMSFATPSETLKKYPRRGEVDCHNHLSWADMERDLSAWTGNPLQDSCLEAVSKMETLIDPLRKSKKAESQKMVDQWRKMQTSDHFYYMCLKFWHDGDVHKYFSPYESPYEAYISYMGVLAKMKNNLVLLNKNKKNA